MRAVELDYLARRRQVRWLGVALLAAALVVAAGLGSRFRDAQLERARLDAQSALAAPEHSAPRPASKERLEEETRAAEAVVRQLTLPWGALIRAIEHAGSADVALLQLQPDAESRSLRLTAEARHPEAMFEYLRRLAAAPSLAHVHLVSHQLRPEHPRRPIQFSVQGTLR